MSAPTPKTTFSSYVVAVFSLAFAAFFAIEAEVTNDGFYLRTKEYTTIQSYGGVALAAGALGVRVDREMIERILGRSKKRDD